MHMTLTKRVIVWNLCLTEVFSKMAGLWPSLQLPGWTGLLAEMPEQVISCLDSSSPSQFTPRHPHTHIYQARVTLPGSSCSVSPPHSPSSDESPNVPWGTKRRLLSVKSTELKSSIPVGHLTISTNLCLQFWITTWRERDRERTRSHAEEK